jgi:hypothetical protein
MNVHRISAIASVTFRDALRSRLLLSLVLLLILGLLALPALIQGDGTLLGRVQVMIRYALGFAVAILSVTTLWTACGGIAREIEDRRFYLIAAKPVHRHEIWIGKWLAIVAMNAGLLLLVGVTLSGMLAWTLRPGNTESPAQERAIRQLLLARSAVTADPPQKDFDARVEQETQTIIDSGRAPDGMAPDVLARQVRRHLTRSAFSLPPGGSLSLAFTLPSDRLPDQDGSLVLKSASSRPERSSMAIRWELGRGEHQVSVQTTNYPGPPWQQLIPAKAMAGPAPFAVTLTREPAQDPATLILAPDGEAPQLLVPVGGFGPNLARALLVVLCRLAFLAALGLTAGCLLSMPVAVFVAFFVIVLLASSGYVETVSQSGVFYVAHEGPQPEPTWLDTTVIGMFRSFNTITKPMLHLDPVPLLAEGRLVSWAMTGKALLVLGVLYSGVAAAVGIALFRKRELG